MAEDQHHTRDRKIMSRRDMAVAAVVVGLVAVIHAVVRYATGADVGTAVWNGVTMILAVALGLTVNQVAARRRARRRAAS